MKTRIAALLILAVCIGFAVSGQPRGERHNPAKMIEHRVAALDHALSLTPDQKTAITRIFTNEMERRQAQASKRDEQTPRMHGKEGKAQFEAAQRDLDEKINAVLTDEQRAKYETFKLERRNHKAPGPRHHGKGHHGKRHQGDKMNCCGDMKDCCKDMKDCCGKKDCCGDMKDCSKEKKACCKDTKKQEPAK